MTINIEIIGKKLSVRTNTGNKGIIEDFDFEPFSQLLEQDEVFIGITASMNQNKKITINDFSLSEISIMEKGDFVGGKSNYTAGETISLFFSIKSICGKFLKIYPNEYSTSNENNTNLSLIINNDVEAPAKIVYTFNDTTTTLRFDISRIKTGTYTALVKFKDNYSSPVQFTINPGSGQRLEICYDKEITSINEYDSSNLDQTKDTFTVPICAYDQYNNSKKIELTEIKNLITVLYPYYVHSNSDITFTFIDNEVIYYKIPFTTFGLYQIFNRDFKQSSTRIFNLTVNSISPQNSDATILYGKHLVKSGEQEVTLRLKLRDEFGRDIPNNITKEMGCNFDESYVANSDNTNVFDGINKSIMDVQYEKNDIIHLVFNPETLGEGKYTFVPKIKCNNDLYDLTLKCSETEENENSIYDKCAFYKVSDSSSQNNNKIRVYSDFLNEYIYLNKGNNDKILLVSLDESTNRKLTEINLLDNSDYPMIDPTSVQISCTFDSDDLIIQKVGYFISLSLKKERTEYDNTQKHSLVITIEGNSYNVYVKFVSVDKLLNNMYILNGGNGNPIAFYQQESYTIKASKNILLFEIFKINSNSYLIKDSSVKNYDIQITINDKTYYKKNSDTNEVAFIDKEYSVLISTNLFTEEKTYTIELKVESYVKNVIVNVVASEEVNKIMNEKNEEISKSFTFEEEYTYFYLGDKYGNRIKDNNAILAFSKLELSSSGLKAQINMDGKLFIFSENSSFNENSIIIKLPTELSYTITQKKAQKEQNINPHKSYGLLNMDSPEIKYVDTTVTVNIYLYDDDGNEIISNNLQSGELENFDVYMIEKFGNKKRFISLNESRIITGSNTIIFNTKVYNVGEYEIKIFYKNILVSCKACNLVVSASTQSFEEEKIKLFIVGNKRKIPVFMDNEYPQFLWKKKNFIFYLQFYDKYYNEITINSQYSLTLNSTTDKIKLCHYGNSKQEGKQFYHICSDQLKDFYNLPEGIYSIEVNGKHFLFFLSDKEIDDSTNNKPVKALYHQYENETYGTTDSVVSLIVDLRNDKNMRMNLNNILSDISINLTDSEILSNQDYTYNKFLGPDKGLFTLLINIRKIGKYSLKMLYNKGAIASKDLQVIISCGEVHSLDSLPNNVYYNGVGSYSFFQVQDINKEKCNYLSNNSWNIFNDDNYIENLIKALNTKSSKYISTTKYYNHMKGVLTVMISSDINDDVTLSSDVFSFEKTISQSTLSKEKVNREYLYAELYDSDMKVKLTALKKNYEPYESFVLGSGQKLTLSILRYVNDETVLVNEYTLGNGNEFSYNKEDVESPGDYSFVVYLNGETVPCENCNKKVKDSSDKVSYQDTKVYYKNGYNKYVEGNKNLLSYIYKSNFPFFKINFLSSKKSLVKLTENEVKNIGLKIRIGNNELGTEIKVNEYNGNVYLYLTEDGRNKYLSSSEKTLNLYINQESVLELILFEDYSSNGKNYEKCNIGAKPVIPDIKSSYIMRADEYKEIEVYLEGCTEQVNKIDANSFEAIINGSSSDISLSAIPADTYGDYLLFINYKKKIIKPVSAYIKYHGGKTDNFKISVLPGYDISSVTLHEDDELVPNTNYKYAYILMELKDSKNNIITNLGRNLFFNDINLLKVTDSKDIKLPYKLSFVDSKDQFRVEIPINGNGNIKISAQNSNDDLVIKVDQSEIFHNTNVEMAAQSNKNFKFSLNFLDNFYKDININNFNYNRLSFIYITENSVTKEFYSIKLSSQDFTISNNEINIKLSDAIPIYRTYSFIPIIDGFTQICYNCQQKNDFGNYIHSIHNDLFYPHALSLENSKNNEIYLQKNYEYPLFIYFSSSQLTISPKDENEFKIADNLYYYIFGVRKDESLSEMDITLQKSGSEIKKIKINFNDNMETYSKELKVKIEKYYYNYISFISGNNGKLLDLYFYIDLRTDSSKPIYVPDTQTSDLLKGDSDSKNLIEYLNVFQTEINGTFLVIIPNNKLINGNYKIKMGENTMEENSFNSIVFNSVGSFPNNILLNNKEMIYKNLIKYDLVGQNNNSELICDERLNIYIEPISKKKFIKGDIVNDNKNELTINSCKLYIKFIGDISIITNIGDGFKSELTNSDNSLYNINPHYSKLEISPNVIDTENYGSFNLSMLFNERSSDDLSFNTDEIPSNKGLKSVKYITPTKYELTQNISGLFSSVYKFSPSQFNIDSLGTYMFISSISNNNFEKPVFVSYIKKQAEEAHHFTIKYIKDNKMKSIDDVLDTEYEVIGETLSIKYPFKLLINILDNHNSLVKVENKLTVSIFSHNKNSVTYDFQLNVKQINDYDFIVEPSIDTIDQLIHMQTKNELNKFYLKFQYDQKLTNYTLLNSKNENNLHPRVNRRAYGKAGQTISGTELINEYETENEKTFYVIPNESSSETYCLIDSAGTILNNNIDITKISCDNNKVTYTNSYRGCIKVGVRTDSTETITAIIKYDNNNIGTINIKPLDSSNIDFKLISPSSQTIAYNDNDFGYNFNMLVNSQKLTSIYSKYFSIYLNGQRLKKSEYAFSTNGGDLSIKSSDLFLSTLVPEKHIKVIYNRGVFNSEKDLGEITINIKQENYKEKASINDFKAYAQVPVDIKSGDVPYFYLTIKDLKTACYYGTDERLNEIENIKGKLANIKEIIDFSVNSTIKLDNVSTCEYIYVLRGNREILTSGLFEVEIKDERSSIIPDTSKVMMYVATGEFKTTTLELIGDKNNIYAGDTFKLEFKTKDANSNTPNFYDISEHFDIKLISNDDEGDKTELDEKYIKYQSVKVPESRDKIEIIMNVIKSGKYNAKIKYKNEEIKLSSTFNLNIKHKDCSFFEPDVNITQIDYRNSYFYSGEEVEINIYCKDIFGNLIKEKGAENFKANVNNTGNIITSVHDFDTKDHIHKIHFTTESEGQYIIQVMLNGKEYSNPLTIKVEQFNENKFMCMNKYQVDNLEQCVNDKYMELIKEIETGKYTCGTEDEIKKGKVFSCLINNSTTCTYNTSYCDCESDYERINGYCYPKEIGPIDLASKNQNKINCLAILQGKGINSAKQCKDGSCRINGEDCDTKFECPLGFKSCGNKCILLNEKCELSDTCTAKGQVLCWDYTCANSYSLCPTRKTCPPEKVLCPDGTCQTSGHCPQPINRKCTGDNKIQCPDFTCVKDINDCHKNKVCPIGQSLCEDDTCSDKCISDKNKGYKCSNGKYVNNSQLCPTEMYCPSEWIKCPEGGCAKSQEGCKFIKGYQNIVCPKNKPVLCPDYECVKTSNDCRTNYPICPPHKPYKCWNNECRKSFNECPTEISCPSKSPLLCSNGLCVSTINNCEEKSLTVECSKDEIRCFDGSCAKSNELCPTHSYCGKDIKKCWNGACVEDVSNCLQVEALEACTGDLPYRCPDGTCRSDASSCSTISVCPNSLPVKCFDNSCRATIEECPEYHSCGINKVSCPDGTCAKSFDECNTIITCHSSKPYLCYDGSCRAQLEECPVPPSCGNQNVQCPNGLCATSRQYCKLFSACEAKTPVRCEMNACAESINKCIVDRQCPIGYVKCSNGDCKIMASLCEEKPCPPNMPYRCKEGVCVDDEKYCDKENGCPYNMPIKCNDGNCVKDSQLCENTDVFCPDGSKKIDDENCPLPNGCPKDKSLKCADGTCIDPALSKCPPVSCPRENPIKCLNGFCAKKSSDCSSYPNDEDLLEDGLIMCLDGRKVPSYDYCRPIFKCPDGYTKCLDNSCRLDKNDCPTNITCPDERPFRGESGFCQKYNETNLYCPYGTTICKTTGECIKNEELKKEGRCPANPLNKNGCPKEGQIRCDNGRCMNSESECLLASSACPDDENPFLCSNGECASNLTNCAVENKCPDGFIRCNNGRCVEDNEQSYLNNCTNEIGCPFNSPYRCSNGECVSNQKKCNIFNENNGTKILNTICDSSKPYLCSDYSCESDYSFCKFAIPCPENFFKCYNGYCVQKEEDCEKFKNYCPPSNPIRCPSGSCTTNILKCTESFPQESCEDGEFYCVRLGKCAKKKSECLVKYNSTKKNDTNRFLLSEGSSVLCYDGSYASSGECPVVPSCKVGQFRCENGACAYNKDLCIVDDEYKCEAGEQKCPDGLCHKSCDEIAYSGCLVGEYLCSNGMCVKSEVACVGYSMCEDPSVPYRCMDGECKSDITLCPEVERISSVKNISYSFNKDNKIEFDFSFDPKGRSIGKLIIPSKGINIVSNYSKINIQEVATSLVTNNTLYNNTPEFLYNVADALEGSEGVLYFENAIMSPVFKFYSEELSQIKFNIPALLVLEHNTYNSPSLYFYDYCLAKLSNFDFKKDKLNSNGESQWECVQRFEREDQKEFKIEDFGVYAIILNPLRNKTNYEASDTKNFIFENMKIIIILLIIVVVFSAGVYYLFSRVLRYRGKYKDNKAKIELLKQQKEEYKQMQTDVFGQTLGDNLIGIVYSKNPGFDEEDEEMKDAGGLENEIEEIQRQCRNLEMQNEKLKENLDELQEEYKQVNSEIEEIKK